MDRVGWLADDGPVPTAKVAAADDLPPAYFSKHLQALSSPGIVVSTPPARRLPARARPEEITSLEVVTAIEGPDEAFRETPAGGDKPATLLTRT